MHGQPQHVWRGPTPVGSTPARDRAAAVVLVVTGDAGLREASARVLEREGYSVLTAAHAGHAVLACMKAGRIDLLAAELSMDDLSGPGLAARLRRHCPGMGAIYFGQSGTVECEGVLVRPFTRDDLLTALASARAGVKARRPTSAS